MYYVPFFESPRRLLNPYRAATISGLKGDFALKPRASGRTGGRISIDFERKRK